METFSAVARYKGEGRMRQFTVLSSWESVMGEICARWAVDVSQVRVKFVMPEAYRTLCPIEYAADFERMCHIYHSFNKFIIDIIIEDVSVSADGNQAFLIPSGSLSDSVNPSGNSFLSQHNSSGALSIAEFTDTHDGSTLQVGQWFENAEHFKDCLRSYAIRKNFDFTFIKNDKLRVTVRCATKEFQWRVHASKEGIHDTFRLKTMQATHICSGGIGTTAHPKASKKWICERVIHKLKETPLYRAVNIQKDILCDHGVRLPYKLAWMGKEVVRSVIHGSEVSSYDLLLWYANKVSETNPSSVVTINKDGERFKSAFFFSFEACLLGFKHGCRPLLFIDGTHLLAKYGGILLGATAKDGNDGLFHVAFAIVDNETDEN
ncbi:uncharacterized protein LOC120267282 [Dioscorea cayenensis subsp. rotundata]|uniref:Uncharacterized protein LOC120267282 n=1 Tax=Dioscorea cayennensis subsp. rotundata TaxID=55577 RepID=A0AB40BVC1_DIOCR|nr:uncharacterized protein LOC120267282 [Dioscorea cayenensis subsp. rotundata]